MDWPRRAFKIAITIAVIAFHDQVARAEPSIYSVTNSTTDQWSAGTHWDHLLISAAATELFVRGYSADEGGNVIPLPGGTVNTSTIDQPGAFQLNRLELGAVVSVGNTATINIVAGSASTGLELLAAAARNPIVYLSTYEIGSGQSPAGVVFHVNAPLTLGADTTFHSEDLASNFVFHGTISGDHKLIKTGSGGMTVGNLSVRSLDMGSNSPGDPYINAGGSIISSAGSSLSIGSGSAADELVIGAQYTYQGPNDLSTLNASAADHVTVSVGKILLGVRSTNSGKGFLAGRLDLGKNNQLTASQEIVIGRDDFATPYYSFDRPYYLGEVATTASSTTVIQTPSLVIGGNAANAFFRTGADSSLTISGLSGGRAILSVGVSTTGGGQGSVSGYGTADFSGSTFNGFLSQLVIGRLDNLPFTSTGPYASGTSESGNVILGNNASNHLDISGPGSVVQIGKYIQGYAGGGGTLQILNLDQTSTITSTDNSTAILLADVGGLAATHAFGTLMLGGNGTLTITTTGSAIRGGGGSSSVIFNGMTLRAGAANAQKGKWITGLSQARIDAGGAKLDTNGFDVSTDQVFTGSGNLTKLGSGTLTMSGDSRLYFGGVTASEGKLVIEGSLGSIARIEVNPGASVQLENPISLNDYATLVLSAGAGISLDFDGTETIGALWINGEASPLAPTPSPT